MAGGAAHAAHAHLAVGHGGALHHALHGMAAVEVHKIEVVLLQVQAGGEHAVKRDGRAGPVHDARRAGDHVVFLKHGVEQHNLQVGPAIAQRDFQRFTCAVQRGQALKRGFFLQDAVGGVAQLHVPGAVRKGEREAGRAVVAAAGRGVFLRREIQRVTLALHIDLRRSGKGCGPHRAQAVARAAAQLAAEMQVLQIAVAVRHHLVSRMCRLQREHMTGFLISNHENSS